MNAFTKRNESLAAKWAKPRIFRTLGSKPRSNGFYIESAEKALASRNKNSALRLAKI